MVFFFFLFRETPEGGQLDADVSDGVDFGLDWNRRGGGGKKGGGARLVRRLIGREVKKRLPLPSPQFPGG